MRIQYIMSFTFKKTRWNYILAGTLCSVVVGTQYWLELNTGWNSVLVGAQYIVVGTQYWLELNI